MFPKHLASLSLEGHGFPDPSAPGPTLGRLEQLPYHRFMIPVQWPRKLSLREGGLRDKDWWVQQTQLTTSLRFPHASLCHGMMRQRRHAARGAGLVLTSLAFPLWKALPASSATSPAFLGGPIPGGPRQPNGFLVANRPQVRGSVARITRSAVFSVIAEEVNNRPVFFFGEVFIIVVLSAAFEKAEKWIRKELKASGDTTGREILDALFREITILGFIGLLLFVLTHLIPEDAPLIYLGSDAYNILPETFEYVHMATFLLLVVLLFQGFAVLRLSRDTARTWAYYETTRAFGKDPLSMESLLVSEGYLERSASDAKSQTDIDESKIELRMLKTFSYGDTILERASLRSKYVHKLIMWRAVRHGFLFEGAQSDLLASEGIIPGLFSFEVFLEQQLAQIAAWTQTEEEPTSLAQ